MSTSSSAAVAKDLTAGTVAGVCQLIVGHPFDTIKVKLQAQPKPAPGQPPLYTGAIDAVRKTIAAEGAGGLYAGIGPPLATVAVFNAVLFTARGQMEALLGKEKGKSLSVGQSFIAGGGAGFAVAFVACPTELVKCRLQAQSAMVAQVMPSPAAAAAATVGVPAGPLADAAVKVLKYKGPMDVARQVVQSEGGMLGLFRGFTPTLLREIPGNACMFGAYEATKQVMAGGRDTSSLGRGHLLAAGGVAGAVFWASVYPTDVIKSMIQVDDFKNPKYKGMVDAFQKVWASEGAAGLYRGFGPAMARSVPANAACFLAYEVIREAMG
eukprot:TRINITY_DN33429_c0_g1_i1.p1 TRINITY_DN33429_c0_g1~~TRINITY_DN33429_c0_g1_i1.p1  ORF type:complete len:324 (-),score=45.22 TRINITY_DN33429_c0_g1_i1:58-1029(-)